MKLPIRTKAPTMKLRPLHDRVIIKKLDAETISQGGIIIPDAAVERPDQGEVMAVGPGKRNEIGRLVKIDMKVGDKVLFGKFAGSEIKIDGVEYFMMKEEEILAVIS